MISQYILIFLTALLPFSEIRGAIPLGVLVFHLSFLGVFLIAVLGNLAGAILAWLVLKYGFKVISSLFPNFKKFHQWLFKRTEKKHQKKFEVLGDIALISFVAIPLPFTGAWSGVLAGFVFGVPFKKLIFLISIGVFIAAFIVSLLTIGIVK